MNLIDQINKVKEESYEKWFERWYKNSNLENKILQAAQEGYSGYQLSIKRTYESESNWDKKRAYKARRMRDKRTVENIQNKLGEGLKVKYVSNVHEGKLLGIPTTKFEDYISINWEAKQ